MVCHSLLQETTFCQNSPPCWERLMAEGEGITEDEMVGWHHRLDGHKFEQASWVADEQGSLTCCSPWGHKELDMTEWLNWSELNAQGRSSSSSLRTKGFLLFSLLLFSCDCSVRLRRPSYLSFLFSGNLHSVGYIFPFILCPFSFCKFLVYKYCGI